MVEDYEVPDVYLDEAADVLAVDQVDKKAFHQARTLSEGPSPQQEAL